MLGALFGVFFYFCSDGICKILYDSDEHMGKYTLIECMKELVLTPYKEKICVDVAMMCEARQKGQYQREYANPPLEMVMINCVPLLVI